MKEKKKLTIGGIFSQIVLLILAVIVLYPLAFMFLTSIKSNLDVLTNPFGITTFKPENYVSAWKIGKITIFSKFKYGRLNPVARGGEGGFN